MKPQFDSSSIIHKKQSEKRKKTTGGCVVDHEILITGAEPANRPLRLLLMKPLTGKTHQLRVACKSLAGWWQKPNSSRLTHEL